MIRVIDSRELRTLERKNSDGNRHSAVTRFWRALHRGVVQSGPRARGRVLFDRRLAEHQGGAPAVGRDAIREVVRGFMTAFPDMVLRMDDARVEGDRAVYRWTFAGTNTGPSGTGQQVLFSGFEEWEIGADGLISGSLGHFDEEDYQRQLDH